MIARRVLIVINAVFTLFLLLNMGSLTAPDYAAAMNNEQMKSAENLLDAQSTAKQIITQTNLEGKIAMQLLYISFGIAVMNIVILSCFDRKTPTEISK